MAHYANLRRVFMVLLSLLLVSSRTLCQFFEENYPSLNDYRSLGVSVAAQEFTPRSSNPQPDSAQIQFRVPLFVAEYRQEGVRIAFGYSSYRLNHDTRSEINLALESVTDISFVREGNRGSFVLPVIFSTSFVQAGGTTNTAKDFNIASVGVGTGLKYKHITEDFGIQLTGVGVLSYSTAGFSIENGSSTTVIAEAQLLFRDVIAQGMTVGYRFESQAWNMSDPKLNYFRFFHGPFLGIFF